MYKHENFVIIQLMIQKRALEFYGTDSRGIKSQLREADVQFDGVEAVECPKGKVRGSHWHPGETEYLQVFSGEVQVALEHPDGVQQELTLQAGEYIVIPPRTKHRITGVDDAILIIPFQGSSSIEDSHKW